MKKTVNVTIEEEDWNWLKSNHVNISSWIRALIVSKRNESSVNIEAEAEEAVNGLR